MPELNPSVLEQQGVALSSSGGGLKVETVKDASGAPKEITSEHTTPFSLAREADVIGGGDNTTIVGKFSADEEIKIVNMLQNKLRAAKSAAENGAATAYDVILATKALDEFQGRVVWRRQEHKDSNENPPDLSGQAIAAVYFSALADQALIYDIAGDKIARGEAGWKGKMKEAGAVFEKLGWKVPVSEARRQTAADSHESPTLSYIVNVNDPEAVINYFKDLENIRRRVYVRMTGKAPNSDAVQQYMERFDQSNNLYHRVVAEGMLGSDVRPEDGILGRSEFAEYYQGKDWKSLTMEERAAVWRQIKPEQLNRVRYDAIQQGATRYLGDLTQAISKEVGQKVATEGTYSQVNNVFTHHLEGEKAKSKDKLSDAEKEVKKLEKEEADIKELKTKLDGEADTEGSVKHAEAQRDKKKRMFEEYYGEIDPVTGVLTKTGRKSQEVKDVNDEVITLKGLLGEATKKYEDAKAAGASGNALAALGSSLNISQLQAELSDRMKYRRQLQNELTQMKLDVQDAEDLVRTSKEKQTEVNDRINGTGGKTKLEVDLKAAREALTNLQKGASGPVEQGKTPKIPDSDKDGQAMLRTLFLSEGTSYNNMMDEHYRRALSDYYNQKDDANGITIGIDNFRRAVLEEYVGHDDVNRHDADLNELMISELDYVKVMVRALRITDIDLTQIDTPDNRKLVDDLEAALTAKTKVPADITAARTALHTALGDARKRVMDEIGRSNKFQLSEALRITVMDLQDKVIHHDEYGGVFGHKTVGQPEPAMRPRKEKVEPEKGYKIGIPDAVLHEMRHDPEARGAQLWMEMYRRMRGERETLGIDAMVQMVSIPDGAGAGDYFIVTRTRETGVTSSGLPAYTPYQEVYDARGKRYGEISEEAYKAGRVRQETVPIREQLLMRLKLEEVNKEISANGKGEYWDGTRKYVRDPKTNRIYLTEGPEVKDAKGKRLYIDEILKQGGKFATDLMTEGNKMLIVQAQRMKDYREKTLGKIGGVDTKSKADMTEYVWSSPLRQADGQVFITMQGERIVQKGTLRPTKFMSEPIKAHLLMEGGVTSGTKGLVEVDCQSFDEVDAALHANMRSNDVQDYYAGWFQRLMTLNEANRNNFLKSFHVIPIDLGSVSSGQARNLEVIAENGELIVRKKTNNGGTALPQDKQEPQTIQTFLNSVIKGNTDYDKIVREVESAIGKEFLKRSMDNYFMESRRHS